MTFHREFDKDFDWFAVAGKTLLPGKLAPSKVGYVPCKLSQYSWYALRYDAIITSTVKDESQKRSPLVQGGLEILIEMSIVWDDAVKIKKRKEKLETVQIGDYTDQSNEILREMRVDVDEENEESWKDCFCISLYCDEILVIFWKKTFFLKHPVTIT